MSAQGSQNEPPPFRRAEAPAASTETDVPASEPAQPWWRSTAAALIGSGAAAAVVLVVVLVLIFGPSADNTTVSRDEIANETEEETFDDGGSAPQQQNFKILELADLAELVGPSVVQVDVTRPEGAGTGSGFVLDKRGTIVTNSHVIEDATGGRIVFADRTSVPITGYLGMWPRKDIALVRVECPPEKLHPLRLATSEPRRGERVAAFGSPLGLQQSVSEGIVSAVRESKELRTLSRIDVNARLIQTTAPISPGNSGGPLVDMKGLVVGVNTAGVRGENINFAVAVVEFPPLLLAKSETPSPLPASDPAARDKDSPPQAEDVASVREPQPGDARLASDLNMRIARGEPIPAGIKYSDLWRLHEHGALDMQAFPETWEKVQIWKRNSDGVSDEDAAQQINNASDNGERFPPGLPYRQQIKLHNAGVIDLKAFPDEYDRAVEWSKGKEGRPMLIEEPPAPEPTPEPQPPVPVTVTDPIPAPGG